MICASREDGGHIRSLYIGPFSRRCHWITGCSENRQGPLCWVVHRRNDWPGSYLELRPRLRSLALCDTGSIIPQEAQPIWQERFIKRARKGWRLRRRKPWSAGLLRLSQAKRSMLDIIRKQILATSVQGYIGCAEAIRKLNYLDRLHEIKIPTLIMVGEDDPGRRSLPQRPSMSGYPTQNW